MTTVSVITAFGVRSALLVATVVDRRDRTRCRVRIRGERNASSIDPHCVYPDAEAARRAWERARAHQEEMARAGARVRVIDAHLSLQIQHRRADLAGDDIPEIQP